MSDRILTTSPAISQQLEPTNAPALSAQCAVNATVKQSRNPVTARSRLKATRVVAPIDHGFRPFRVF